MELFSSVNITLNASYLLHILLICMCQFKFRENQDELKYNVGYLLFIDE